MINEDEYSKIVAKNLKWIAYDRGKTQAQICRDLGISKQTLSSWMTGKRLPRMNKIDMLCNYFNCLRDDLLKPHGDNFRYGGEIKRLYEDEVKLLDAYHSAPDSIQSAVRKLLDLGGEK